MKKEQRLKLGLKFMVARSAKKLTQKQIAGKLGIGQSHYQKIEAGNVAATIEQFIGLCFLLDLGLEDFAKATIDEEYSHSQNTLQLIVQADFEESSSSIRETFENIIRRKDKIISIQRRQLNNLLKDAYGVSA